MNWIRKFITIFLLFFLIKIKAYRILGVFPLAFKSHNIFFLSVMNGLAKNGHQVDVISYYEHKNPHTNYKTIINLNNLTYDHPKVNFNSIEEPIAIVADIVLFSKDYYGLNVCNLMSNKKFQEFFQNPPKNPSYDIVITEVSETLYLINLVEKFLLTIFFFLGPSNELLLWSWTIAKCTNSSSFSMFRIITRIKNNWQSKINSILSIALFKEI